MGTTSSILQIPNTTNTPTNLKINNAALATCLSNIGTNADNKDAINSAGYAAYSCHLQNIIATDGNGNNLPIILKETDFVKSKQGFNNVASAEASSMSSMGYSLTYHNLIFIVIILIFAFVLIPKKE